MIDVSEAAALLRQMVQIPSVNPRDGDAHAEGEMGEFVAVWMEQNGVPAQIQEVLPGRPNVIATLKGRDPSRILLLESHMDTVEVEGMTVEPFAGQIQDGRLYGRGACDAKGPLAAFMLAMADLAKRGVTPPISVMLAAVMDEEYQYRGVSHLLREYRGFTAAIVGEPTELNLVVAHKGSVRFQVTTLGKAAHSSMPWEGDNAIERMAGVIKHIQGTLGPELAARRHPRVGPATLCISLIRGGSAVNTVPEQCSIDIDRRTLPGEEPEEIWRDYKRRLEALAPRKIRVGEPYILDFALDTDAQSPLVTTLSQEVRAVGKDPEVAGVNYGTDASKIARLGVPTVVFGPGSIRQAHSAAEYIDTGELATAAQVLANLLERFDGRGS